LELLVKKTLISALLLPLLSSVAVSVQAQTVSLVPDSGAYVGLGVGLNATNFRSQQLEATGISTVTNTATGAPVSSGSAGGPAVGIDLGTAFGFSPSIQAGYFQRIRATDYLWGVKFAYDYMGDTTATKDGVRIPQFGSFSDGTPFTGNAIASSYQKTINHQFALIPYFGRAFDRGTLYLGLGPTLSEVNTSINNLVGFADLNGNRTDVSGTPQSFSATQWVWGATVMLGGTYYLDKSWFLDFSYSYSMTQNKTANYYSTFNNPSSPNTFSGSLIGASTGNSTTQSIKITINRLF
jgi:opacity protein-like surface antigen